jgi:hypothetical protein
LISEAIAEIQCGAMHAFTPAPICFTDHARAGSRKRQHLEAVVIDKPFHFFRQAAHRRYNQRFGDRPGGNDDLILVFERRLTGSCRLFVQNNSH